MMKHETIYVSYVDASLYESSGNQIESDSTKVVYYQTAGNCW